VAFGGSRQKCLRRQMTFWMPQCRADDSANRTNGEAVAQAESVALGKYVSKGLGYEGAPVGSVIHFRGGTKWLTSGCG
jgi:hypothetical protein